MQIMSLYLCTGAFLFEIFVVFIFVVGYVMLVMLFVVVDVGDCVEDVGGCFVATVPVVVAVFCCYIL